MKKNLGIFLYGVLFVSLLLALGKPVSAHHKEQVLGEATSASELVFPPTTAGTGFILPDSPLFFLDEVFQSLRLSLAFGSEGKARVRAQIAGERLAELRVMLSRNDPDGINTALTQLTKQVADASVDLADASSQGKDMSVLAKQFNETVKVDRKILGELASRSSGALKLQLQVARRALKEAKVEIEDELPEDELLKEVQEDLEDSVDENASDAESLVEKLERDLNELDKQATEAAKRSLKNREEALKKAIEEKNNELVKAEEKKLEIEKKKQEKLLDAQKKATIEARKAVADTKRAVRNLERAQDVVDEIRNKPAEKVASPSSR